MQQIEWHKGDVPVWGALFVFGLCAATAFLVNAAVSPKTANPLLVVLCSIYASLGAVTAIRQAFLATLDRADVIATRDDTCRTSRWHRMSTRYFAYCLTSPVADGWPVLL